MALFNLLSKRSVVTQTTIGLGSASDFNLFFGRDPDSDPITEEEALSVPAINAAVMTIAGTIGSLPCLLYKRDDKGNMVEDTANPLYYLLNQEPNENKTSTEFFKWIAIRMLLEGRACAAIVRNKAGRVKKLRQMDPSKIVIDEVIDDFGNVTRLYHYTPQSKRFTFEQKDVIDIVWWPHPDGLKHYNPIWLNRRSINVMLATEKYAARLFSNGGVPQLALEAPQMSSMGGGGPATAARASEDMAEAVKAAAAKKNGIVYLPGGHKLSPIGVDPSKMSLVELRQFQITEVSRMFNIAPALLHDLSHGTYSNVEYQNLSYAGLTIKPMVEAIKQEFNRKLFGQKNNSSVIDLDMNDLMRGDFKTRMEGYARAINAAILTPNEVRGLENWPSKPEGDDLLIQGATVKLGLNVPKDGSTVPGNNNPDPEADDATKDEPTTDQENTDEE